MLLVLYFLCVFIERYDTRLVKVSATRKRVCHCDIASANEGIAHRGRCHLGMLHSSHVRCVRVRGRGQMDRSSCHLCATSTVLVVATGAETTSRDLEVPVAIATLAVSARASTCRVALVTASIAVDTREESATHRACVVGRRRCSRGEVVLHICLF